MAARYAIGIDLGTTNCALAYVDLRAKARSPRVLAVPQLNSLNTVASGELLPSFFYFATEAEMAQSHLNPFATGDEEESTGFIVGAYARDLMSALPGRVIHSAKSWLAHGGIDREAQILPFGSDEVPPELRLSPVEASAAYLEYLRAAWDDAFAREDPANAFERQRVVVTVPASFDEGAQALTRMAAQMARYPAGMRLLEEPQAAFYAWIEHAARASAGGPGARFLEALPKLAGEPQTVLVIDVGGGTSDFSLFRIAPVDAPDKLPGIERIAASDHLLLGGDNIDLALAHFVERRLLPDAESRLSRRQWDHLVPQARLLKERILEGAGAPDETFHVSVPGEGGSLFKSALGTTLTRADVENLVLEGFYPLVAAEDKPRSRAAGLRELGLPYAADTAVTRHVAAFLAGRRVHAVLFAGGSLKPRFLRERLTEQIGRWQGEQPAQLEPGDMSLAIAEGAAHFAALLATAGARIRGGYARSVYLELARQAAGRAPELVCVLPQGFEEGGRLRLAAPRLTVLVNQPVRFSAYTASRRPEDQPGTLIGLDQDVFHPLPPLHATLTVEGEQFSARKATGRELSVQLEAELTELGVLELALFNEQTRRRWQLEFNLRQPQADGSPAADGAGQAPEGPGVAAERLQEAEDRIGLFFGRKQAPEGKDNVKALPRDLERILGERSRWSLPLLRALWPALYPGMTRRGRSLAHENAWLYLAGFLLRPGYGSELDAWRMTQLWECFGLGLAHRKEKSAQANWWMMWRRTAGGLAADQQQRLFDAAWPAVRGAPLESVEAVRLLGSLERVPAPARIEVTELLLAQVLKGRAANQQHVFWALARLTSRVPLYTAADAVLPAAFVEDCFARAEPFDWKKQGMQGLAGVFAAACRRTDLRALDVQEAVRGRAIDKLKRAGAGEEQIALVRDCRPVDTADRERLFGEELPVGLRLAG